MDASDLSMSNVSESAGLIATVDALFGIIRTPVMMADNCYYLKAIALRNSPHMGDKKRFNLDSRFLRIDEDISEDIIPEGMDIPAVMRSATQHAVAQINGAANVPVTSNSPYPTQQQPSKLGITEQQLSGTALFGNLENHSIF